MSELFTPVNELENHMLAAQEGRMSRGEFMAELMRSELFMPILEHASEVNSLQPSHTAHPLTLQSDDHHAVVVLFTSPERGKTFLLDHPGYEGGLLAGFTWILEKLGTGHGLCINPGWEHGFDISPEMLKQIGKAE